MNTDRAALFSGLVLLLALCIASLSLPQPAFGDAPTPAASPSPQPSSSTMTIDEKVLGRAKSWFAMLQSGTIDRSQLTQPMNDALTADKLTQISTQLKQLGAPASFTQIDSGPVGPYTVYHYRVGFAAGALIMTVGLDSSGKIAGLNLAPAPASE